jgi:hypothetical protein
LVAPHRHEQVPWARLGVLDFDYPVAAFVEDPGIDQLIFGLQAVALGVGQDQFLIRERCLGVVVAPLVPTVAGHTVQVPPVLFDVLAMVALVAGEPEHALFQDGVPSVPQRQRQAEPLFHVAEACHTVFAPAVST